MLFPPVEVALEPLSCCGSENGASGSRDAFGLDVAGELAQALTIAVVLDRDENSQLVTTPP
jgi:hypothetical protein